MPAEKDYIFTDLLTFLHRKGGLMLRKGFLVGMLLLAIVASTFGIFANIASGQANFDPYRLLNTYQPAPGDQVQNPYDTVASPPNSIGLTSGNYLITVFPRGGRINEVEIQLNYGAHGSPDYELASQFAPYGIDFLHATRGDQGKTITLNKWWEWDLPQEQITVRFYVNTRLSNSPEGLLPGDLDRMGWMWKSYGSQLWGR